MLDRLILAAGLSLAGIVATLTWYQITATKISHGDAPAIAAAAKVRGEVTRRLSSRLVWQTISTGRLLFEGETIRTADNGQLRLEFFDGRYVDIDPNSLILLQKLPKEIKIDILDGNIFVGSENLQDSSSRFTLKSGNGQVDLSRASASIAKTGHGSMDVSVWSGKAVVQNADGSGATISQGNSSGVDANGLVKDKTLKFISPLPGKPYVVDANANGFVRVQFMGAMADARVSLMVGRDQKNLRTVASTKTAEDVEILAKLSSGRQWWKLVATDKTGKVVQQSPIALMEISKQGMPVPVTVAEPEPVHAVVMPPPAATPPPPSRPVAVAPPPSLPTPPAPVREMATSEVKDVEPEVEEDIPLAAPQFEVAPEPVNDGKLNLKWSSIPKAKKYRVVLLRGEQKIQKDFATNEGNFSELVAGDYLATVVAIDTNGKPGVESQPKRVKIPEVSEISASKLKKVLVK